MQKAIRAAAQAVVLYVQEDIEKVQRLNRWLRNRFLVSKNCYFDAGCYAFAWRTWWRFIEVTYERDGEYFDEVYFMVRRGDEYMKEFYEATTK